METPLYLRARSLLGVQVLMISRQPRDLLVLAHILILLLLQ
jgi:hypothetical protein